MKIFNWILAGLFALFAAVQWNDADVWTWMSFYVVITVISAMAAMGQYRLWAILVALTAGVIWMGTLLPDFIHWVQMGMPTIVEEMKATAPHIELTREFLGLGIANAALVWHYFSARKQARAEAGS